MVTITPEQLAASGSEDGHQLALMQWCALNFDKYPQLRRMVHVPNGGFRNKKEAAKLKAMGVKAGFPDLFLPYNNEKYNGLMIEMKKLKGGKTSAEQVDWLFYLDSQNFFADVS